MKVTLICSFCLYLLFVQVYGNKSVIFQPVTSTAARIAAGEITSEEVVGQYLRRAKAVNPLINAITEFNPNAIKEAQELDKYFKENNKVKGPLHGIPITIKDHIGMKGTHQTVRILKKEKNLIRKIIKN